MADITDVIRRIIIQAETLGMDQAASDIRNLASATGSFAQAGAQMGAALGVTETKVTSLGRRFETIANSVEPARIGVKSLARDLKDLDLIMAQRQKLNLSVTEVSRVRDLRVGQVEAAQQAAAEKVALAEIALQGRVDAAMAQYAALRKARAQEVADFEIAQHAKANEDFMRRTAGIGGAPTPTDPRAIADQEQINKHLRSSLIAQGEAYERVAAEAVSAANEEIAAAAKVDSAMASYAAKAKQRAGDQVAYEERIAQARHQQQSAEFGRSFRERVGVEKPPATAGGATFSALAEREAASQKALAAEARTVTEALKAQGQQYAQLVRLAAELRQQISPQQEAASRHDQNVTNYKKLLDLRLIGEHQYQAAVKQSQAVAAGQSKGVGQTAAAFQNLSFQINDVISGVAMGQAPFTILTQQAGQFYQVFSALGGGEGALAGVKTAFKGIAAAVNPVTVAIGAVAGGILYAADAGERYTKAGNDIKISLGGVGKATQATSEELRGIAEASADSGRVSIKAAEEMASTYAATGKIGKSNFASLIENTKDYATTTRQDLAGAQKELGAALADPIKGFDTLNAKLGFGGAALRDQVESLALAGDKYGAQALILANLNKGMVKTEEVTSALSQAYEKLSTAVSNADRAVGKWFNTITAPPSMEELIKAVEAGEKRIAALRQPKPREEQTDEEQRAAARAARTGGGVGGTVGTAKVIEEETAALDKQKEKLNELSFIAAAIAERKREDAAESKARQDSIAASDVTRQVYKELGAWKELREEIDKLNEALANPAAREKLGEVGARRAESARTDLQTRLRRSGAGETPEQDDPIKARIGLMTQNFNLQIQAVRALTVQQQAAAAGEIAYAASMLEVGNAAVAKTAKLQASQMVVEQATAASNKALVAQQVQIDMYGQLAAAAGMQGLAGVQMNAQLQEEISLRGQAGGVLSSENAARAANAGALAVQATALRDIAAAKEIRAAGADQVALINAETASIGANSIARQAMISIMQGENQARAQERQGMTASAAATRETTKEAAVANANKDAWEKYNEEKKRVAEATKAITMGQATEIENLQLEIDMVGRSTRERIMATEALKAEQQIRAAGIPIWGAQAEQIRANAEELGRLKVKADELKNSPTANNKTYQFSIVDPIDIQRATAAYGQGNFEIHGYGDQSMGPVFRGKRYQGYAVPTAQYIEQQAEQKRTATTGLLQSNIGFASGALQKQMTELNKAQTRASEAESRASEIRSKIDAAEQKRQQTIQQAVAFGVSPTQPNADIYYDPVKRKLFAESIAQDTTAMLSVEEKAALAEAEAAKEQAAAAQTQIDLLQGQIDQLQNINELIGAGVQLSGAELQDLKNLIAVVRTELPASIVSSFDRMMTAAGTAAYTAYNKTGGTGGTGFGAGTSVINPPTLDPYKSVATTLGRFQHGGAFTVPGSGGGDRPFRIDLTPGEHVAVTPSGARKQSGGGGTNIENLIVQMPPGADPTVYLNKRSRPSLGRAVRNAARSM